MTLFVDMMYYSFFSNMQKIILSFFILYFVQINLANSLRNYPVDCKEYIFNLNIGQGYKFKYLELSILEASGKIAQKDKGAPLGTSAPMNLMN